jgi:hypothetical protein
MDFRDRGILRLLDADERAELLTNQVGDRLLAAAYLFDDVAVGQVTSVAVRDVSLLPVVWPPQRVEASVLDPPTGHRWEAMAEIRMHSPELAADAQLDVLLTASTLGVETTIDRVETDLLGDLADLAAIDARIVAEDGALPPEGPDREQRRATALRAMLHERFETDDEVAAGLDAIFDRRGLGDLAALRDFLAAPRLTERLALTMVTDSTRPATARTYRVVAAVVVGAPDAPLRETLAVVQRGRARIGEAADPPAVPAGMRPRTPIPYLVVLPETLLDDADLPLPAGVAPPADPDQLRAARLTELTTRLRPLGVAPAVA